MYLLIECCWTSAKFLLKKSIHGNKSNFTFVQMQNPGCASHSNLVYDGKMTSINSVIQKINKSRCQGSVALQNSVTPHVMVLFSFCTPSCTTNRAGCKGHRFIPTLLLIEAASMILLPCHFAYHSSPNGSHDHQQNVTLKFIRAVG